MKSRPEYQPAYHYPKMAAIPVKDVVLSEQCYINLDPDDHCPKCGTSGATIIYSEGPIRTEVNLYKVFVRIFRCDSCNTAYTTAEVID